MIRFTVETIFDLRSTRGVTVAVGRLLEGTVTGPATLRDLATMREIRVRGVELVMSPKDPEMVSLIIDPTSPSQPEIGMILVDQTA